MLSEGEMGAEPLLPELSGDTANVDSLYEESISLVYDYVCIGNWALMLILSL
jgi:hypothetical protein